MAQSKDTSANAIRFGDYIYLKTNISQTFGGAEPGFLYADGMCLGRTGVQRSAAVDDVFPRNMDECIYQIVPTLLYEKAKAEKIYNIKVKAAEDLAKINALQPEEPSNEQIICKLPMKEVTLGIDSAAALTVAAMKAKLEAKSGTLASIMKVVIGDNEVQDDTITIADAGYRSGEIIVVNIEDPSVEMAKARKQELSKNTEKIDALYMTGPDEFNGFQAPLVYGEYCQLRHVKSGKFVTFKGAFPAEQPNNKGKGRLLKVVANNMVHLDDIKEDVGIRTFRVMSRYSFRQEGDNVENNDAIMFESSEIGGDNEVMRIAGSTEAFKIDPNLYEAIMTSAKEDSMYEWTITKYARFDEKTTVENGDRLLGTGSEFAFRMWHTQEKAFVTSSVEAYDGKTTYVGKSSKAGELNKIKRPYLRRTWNEDPADPYNMSSKQIFAFELLSRGAGGILEWTSLVRIRHLASNKYLAVDTSNKWVDGNGNEHFSVMLVDDNQTKMDDNSIFGINEIRIQPTDKVVQDDQSMRIFAEVYDSSGFGPGAEKRRVWLHSPRLPKTAAGPLLFNDGPRKAGIPEQFPESFALSFIASPEASPSDAFDIFPCEKLEVENVFKCLGYKAICDLYGLMLDSNKPSFPSRIPKAPDDTRCKNVLEMLRQACVFVTNVGDDDIGKDALGTDGSSTKETQQIARECKLMDKLFPMSQEGEDPFNYDLLQMHPNYMYIHRTVFHVLKQIIQDSRRNEVYFAGQKTANGKLWVNSVIEQVGDISTAAELLNMLLSNNVQLLDQHVNKETVQKFIDLIGKDGPHKRFMSFFQAICSCNGSQIISNQELVLNAIVNDIDNQSALMIAMFAAEPPDGQMKMPFKSLSDDAAEKATGVRPTHGKFLGREFHPDGGAGSGFDQVYISWSCSDEWMPGMDELFHSPSILGINSVSFEKSEFAAKSLTPKMLKRHWVQIHHLCWALAPNCLCDSGFKLYDEVFGKRDKRFELLPGPEYDFQSEGAPLWHEKPRIRTALLAGEPVPYEEGELEAAQATADFPPAKRKYTNRQRFECMRQLASYFEAEIDVYAEMCLDRSYNSIDALSTPKSPIPGEGGRGFSYDMLLSLMIDTRLPDQIRASYTMLLLRLWIDRMPHATVPAPNPIQVFTNIKKTLDVYADDALPQFYVNPDSLEEPEPGIENSPKREMHMFLTFGADGEASNKFHMVEDFISDYLIQMDGCQVVEDVEKNTFTVNILQALDRLVKFGFYGTTAEIKDLVDPMISTLDGRADLLTLKEFEKNAALSAEAKLRQDLSDWPPNLDVDRYELTEQSQLVMDSKRSMINALVSICNLRDDFRLRMLMTKFKESIDNQKCLCVPDEKMDGSRIWRLQPTFHANFNWVFESEQGLALDLDDMSAAPLSTILMDLMMYEYPELFEAALTLFKANFSQRECLINAMSTVQLMSTDKLPIFDDLTKLTEAVAQIRNKLESYETWGVENKFSGITYEDRNAVVNNLRDIMRFLAAEPTEPPVDAEPEEGEEEMKVDEDLYGDDKYADWAEEVAALWKKKITREHQDILRNLDFHNILIRGVEIPFHEFNPENWTYDNDTQSKDDMKHTYDCLLEIVASCWECTKFFVTRNKRNQAIFVEQIDMMVNTISGIVDGRGFPDFGVITTVTETYRNNQKLISKFAPETFHSFASIIAANESDPMPYLDFFDGMVFIEPRSYMARSQRILIRVMNDMKFLNLNPASSPYPTDEYLRFIKLATLCCKNRNAAAQSTVQKAFERLDSKKPAACFAKLADAPWSGILLGGQLRWGVRLALMDLITNSFFDTTLVDTAINGNDWMWTMFKAITSAFVEYVSTPPKGAIRDPFGTELKKLKLPTSTYQRIMDRTAMDKPSPDGKNVPYVNWETVEKCAKQKDPDADFPFELSELRDKQYFFSSQESGFLPMMIAFITYVYNENAVTDSCRASLKQMVSDLLDVCEDQEVNIMYRKVAMKILSTSNFGDPELTKRAGALKSQLHLPDLKPKPQRRRSTMTALLGNATPKDLVEKKEKRRQYFALVAEVANGRDDPDKMKKIGKKKWKKTGGNDFRELCEDANGVTETEKMVQCLLKVQNFTEKHDAWKHAYKIGDAKARADGRANTVTEKALFERMMSHVTVNINKEIFSGYDTIGINILVCEIMSQVLVLSPGYDKDEAHVDVESQFYDYQVRLAKYGGVAMVLSVVAYCKEEDLVKAALKFGNLMCKGGNIHVQRMIYEYFEETKKAAFFGKSKEYIRMELNKIAERRRHRALNLIVDEEDTVSTLLIEFIRLWSEGHNSQMQNLTREQTMNKKSYNLIEDVCAVLEMQCDPDEMNMGLSEGDLRRTTALLDFAIEVMQGPCMANQKFIGGTTFTPKICKMFIEKTTHIYNKEKNTVAMIADIRSVACRCLSALMEGSEEPSVQQAISDQCDAPLYKEYMVMVYELIYRVDPKQAPEIPATKAMQKKLVPFTEDELGGEPADIINAYMETCFELYSIYKQLTTSGPSSAALKKKMEYTEADKENADNCYVSYTKAHAKVESQIARVEFVWPDPTDPSTPVDLVFFKRPDVCDAISQKAKDKMMESIDVLQGDDVKKKGFMAAAREMVDEMVWLSYLNKNPIIGKIGSEYTNLRKYGYLLVVLLNIVYAVSVEGPGNMGRSGDDDFGLGDYQYKGHLNPDHSGDDGSARRRLDEEGDDAAPYDLQVRGGLYGKNVPHLATHSLVHFLTAVVIAAYALPFVYLLISRTWLVYKKHTFNLHGEFLKRKSESLTGVAGLDPAFNVFNKQWWAAFYGPYTKFGGVNAEASPFGNFTTAFVFYLCMGAIFWVQYWDYHDYDNYYETKTKRDFAIKTYWGFFGATFGPMFVMSLRKAWAKSGNKVAQMTCVAIDTLTEKDTLAQMIFLTFAALSYYRFYYASLILLDILTLSERLKAVIKAVINPIEDLAQVLMLMIFVSFIFTVYGLYFFGQYYSMAADDAMFGNIVVDDAGNGVIQTPDDDAQAQIQNIAVPDAGMLETCPNLMLCFFETLDQGLRSGDIVDAAFDTTTYQDGLTYADRVVFGLMFFLVVGVILFDIVTGIIIDTFSALREEKGETMSYLRDNSFISGIAYTDYEEIDPRLSFKELQEVDQNKWNYVFFIAHLEAKPESEYNGAESKIWKQIEMGDATWMPQGSSYQMQSILNQQAAESAGEADAIGDLQKDVAALRTMLQHLTEKLTAPAAP